MVRAYQFRPDTALPGPLGATSRLADRTTRRHRAAVRTPRVVTVNRWEIKRRWRSLPPRDNRSVEGHNKDEAVCGSGFPIPTRSSTLVPVERGRDPCHRASSVFHGTGLCQRGSDDTDAVAHRLRSRGAPADRCAVPKPRHPGSRREPGGFAERRPPPRRYSRPLTPSNRSLSPTIR